jgi:hypothetical protein
VKRGRKSCASRRLRRTQISRRFRSARRRSASLRIPEKFSPAPILGLDKDSHKDSYRTDSG